MRAIAVRKLKDEPEEMELPKPTPGPGEILVHVAAAGVNPFDWKIVDGGMEGKMPHEFPLILGVDGAGVVEGLGEGVTTFAVGDGVFGSFLHAPVGRGTYAEYITAPATLAIAPMPRGMYPPQAAAVPTSGMTAVEALDQLGLHKGQSLLILGAAGGVGAFATQLASNAGILPLTASKGPHRDFLHHLGAARFFDANNMAFLDEVKNAYPDGIDAMLDLVNRDDAFTKNLELLKPGAPVASTIGAATDAVLAPRGMKGINIDMHPKVEYLERIGKEFSSGRLRVPVEQTRPLADAPRVIAESREGKIKGKTVLRI